MRVVKNEDGIALVTALMLTLIALAITMALLYLVTVKTRMSGAEKRYKNSYDAAYATATRLYPKDILPSLISNFANYTSTTTAINRVTSTFHSGTIDLSVPVSGACLKQKLTAEPSAWTACSVASKSTDPKLSPDVSFTLQGQGAAFNLYAKIVDTVPGMSDSSGVDLDSGSGVVSFNNNPSVVQQPSLFTFEVQGERNNNTKEKAMFEVLYAY